MPTSWQRPPAIQFRLAPFQSIIIIGDDGRGEFSTAALAERDRQEEINLLRIGVEF